MGFEGFAFKRELLDELEQAQSGGLRKGARLGAGGLKVLVPLGGVLPRDLLAKDGLGVQDPP